MSSLLRIFAILLLLAAGSHAADPKPLKALLILGGCCHDYGKQKDILKLGIEARAHVQVEILYNADRSTKARFEIYENPDWAKGYDVVIHDECSADVKDQPYVSNIINAHKTVPAVNLHCAMHCYRTGTDEWFRFAGIHSTSHGPQKPIEVRFTDSTHPVTAGLTPWTTIDEELYNNVKIFETAKPIASGKQMVPQKDGTMKEVDAVVAWTNQHDKARIFSTTLGHNNATVADDRYLELVTRGLLWACDKLDPAYRKAFASPAPAAPPAAAQKEAAAPAVKSAGVPPAPPAEKAPAEKAPLTSGISPEKEAEIMRDVKVPDAFEAILYASPPLVNYPVFVAAAPDGAVFVSSDGNGSLGRDPHRGRIVRLRDLDGDGRADESKEFVKDLDSPRGLLWDRDRLYVMHPPHLSAFIDKDADGISDEQKILVKGLAFGFKDRPADHTTNGIAMGVDGWIYVAVGDFGFMEAEGTDGRKLQLRGGGVVRVRPDGTGLQLYSRGTRNILEVAVSPLLDLFTRDNTNDGGGWDMRFHHFTGLEDHGYPRLFRNFPDEVVKPVADYGGGSGCGAAWIDEPGFPADWNNAPYTSDWGRNPIFRHRVEAKGASFSEKEEPAAFTKLTRSTDLDVDAMSRVYVASWKGATFNWAGPDVGYIVRVSPKGYAPETLPAFARLSEGELTVLLESPSYRRRVAAQRELLEGGIEEGTARQLETLAADRSKPLASRVAAIFTLKQGQGTRSHAALARLAADDTVEPWAIRALTDRWDQLQDIPAAPLLAGVQSKDARVRREAVIAIARLHGIMGARAEVELPAPRSQHTADLAAHGAAIAPLLADADPRVAHTAVQALTELRVSAPAFAILDKADAPPELRAAALRVLQGIHDPAVVDGLLSRVERQSDPQYRRALTTALCRLYHAEAAWKGSSWGTRPDTRGPFYEPEQWAASQKIGDFLLASLNKSEGSDAAFLGAEFSRHRIRPGDAVSRLVRLAAGDPAIIPALAGQLAMADTVPADAVPFMVGAASDPATKDLVRAHAIQALVKTDAPEAMRAILEALPRLAETRTERREFEQVRDSVFNSQRLENHHQLIEEIAAHGQGQPAIWADAALIKLSTRKLGAPEAREMAGKALDAGWQQPARRQQILRAMLLLRDKSRAAAIVAALEDSDPAVVKLATEAVQVLKLDPAKMAAEASSARPVLVGTLKPEAALAEAVKRKGDIAKGEQIFTQQGCVACHTVSPNEPQRGPFLGNIASTYKRAELAEAILLPNKTMAQGFVTNVFTMKDGSSQMGFVTEEAADKVTIRNIAGQEIAIPTAEIAQRAKDPRSMMPEGLVASLSVSDLASLLDYLQALVKP